MTVDGETAFDDAVMTGYEDLVTDENGTLPKIDHTLTAGTYQLCEKAPLGGYQALSGHVEFAVSRGGAVSLLSPTGAAAEASLESTTDDEGTIAYVLTILNFQKADLTLIKHDSAGAALTGASFKLCARTQGGAWEVVPGYEDIDMTSLSETTLAGLTSGCYQLTETKAPAGYVILTDAVYFDLAFAPDGSAAVTLTDDAGVPTTYDMALVGSGGMTLIVKNTPGVALPDTGGPGVTLIYLVGAAMMGLAGALLVKRTRTSG